MYSLPQEIEVWYIIPAIRKEYAKIFVNKHHLTLERAGNILGISKSAISQYFSNKRGNEFKIPDKIKKEIEKSAANVIKNEDLILFEMTKILALIKREKSSCNICKKHNPEIIKKCHQIKSSC